MEIEMLGILVILVVMAFIIIFIRLHGFSGIIQEIQIINNTTAGIILVCSLFHISRIV